MQVTTSPQTISAQTATETGRVGKAVQYTVSFPLAVTIVIVQSPTLLISESWVEPTGCQYICDVFTPPYTSLKREVIVYYELLLCTVFP